MNLSTRDSRAESVPAADASPRLRIVFLARSLDYYGGAERQLVVLARGLSRLGHTIAVVLLYGGSPLEPELRADGIEVCSLGKRSRYDVVGLMARLENVVRGFEPAIVHSYLAVPNVLAALARRRFRGVVWVAGIRASDMSLAHYDLLSRAFLYLERIAVRRHDAAIVNSQAAHSMFRKFAPQVPIACLPNGIDTDRFCPDASDRARMRANAHIREDQVAVGCVARLDPMKDHATLLEAFALFAERVPNAVLICVAGGDSGLRKDLERRAAALGIADRTKWIAPTPDVQRWYRVFDLFCLSSQYGEGFPNVLAEAMATGVPCIATDCGDSAVVVGDCGRIVPRNSPQLFARAMLEQLDRRGEALSALCRARVKERFSTEALVVRTEAFLRQQLKVVGHRATT
jgi:glycosyltransferase involved in cell wall biosynthesis